VTGAPVRASGPFIGTVLGGPPVTRRTVLRAAALTAGATALGGCGGAEQLEMAVVWSGNELARFRAVLAAIGVNDVLVTSGGDFMHTLLSDRACANRLPHIAILSNPGLLPGYVRRGWLRQLREPDLQSDDPAELSPFRVWSPEWADWLSVDGVRYGAWVKAAHKSLFWCLPERAAEIHDAWRTLIAQAARGENPRPGKVSLAIGAADSWVLTDWFENVLTTNEYNDIFAGGSEVRRPLEVLGRIWRAVRFPGGPRRALLTQFDASVLQVVTGKADAVFEGDFVRALGNDRPGRTDLAGVGKLVPFRFPTAGPAGSLVVGGDFAVLLNRRSDSSTAPDKLTAADLMSLLAGRAAQLQWAQFPGYLSPRNDITAGEYPPLPVDAKTGATVLAALSAGAGARFDLSDRLRPDRGAALGGMLQNFFRRVTEPGSDLHRCTLDAEEEFRRRSGAAPGADDPGGCRVPDAAR
jgi:hypothetical protein